VAFGGSAVADELLGSGVSAPDVYVIAIDLKARHDGLMLIADLRSRSEARTAGIVAVVQPLDIEGAVVALDLGANDVVEHPVDTPELVERLRAQLRRKAVSDRLRQRITDGLKLAVTDPLTGLKNRRFALSALAQVADEAERTGRPFAIMVLDLDHFKKVNDTHGHASGDAVLAEAARRISGGLRSGDMVARMGGEEFMVVMPDTSTSAAAAAGERLRRMVEAVPFAIPGQIEPLHVTISVGIAMGGGPETIELLVDEADRALYSAKAEGRNAVNMSKSAA
jgi:two-component system cell cycle response regulator